MTNVGIILKNRRLVNILFRFFAEIRSLRLDDQVDELILDENDLDDLHPIERLGDLLDLTGSLDDGMAAIIEDGVAKLPDRSSFAGSVCTTDRVVRNYMIKAGASLPEAVQVMTLSPARLMHIDDRKGSIAPGKDADIVLFDPGIDISLTMIGGKVVFRK